MNRLFWGITLMVLVAAGGWAQSTWRGQAEIWTTADAPADGFVAASNEFPRNSLLSVENYKTRKTIQVRVVSALPVGSSALVLLNSKAALALEIKAGEVPLVGVRLDPTGVDRPDNPDPDVNPLAAKTVSPVTTPPAAVTPAVPVAKVTEVPTPTAAPEAPNTIARTPSVSSLDGTRGTNALDPDLLPLPVLADPEPVAEPVAEPVRTPLAVAELEDEIPVTPGRRVFVTTRDSEPVAQEAPAIEAPVTTEDPVPEEVAPVSEAVPEVATITEPEPAPVPVPEPEPEPIAEVAAVPEPAPAPVPPPTTVVPPRPVPSTAWVAVPGKLEGPLLGNVPLLAGLEKGRSYVQVGAWATEAEVLAALGTVKSHVPLALYRAEGEKNPWRVVVPAAPKGQLGVLLMHYRNQGFRGAGMVKG